MHHTRSLRANTDVGVCQGFKERRAQQLRERAEAAADEAVRGRRAERGILLCGSGVGASVAANKIPGIRAGVCHDGYSAHQGVEHDDMNVLCLGPRIVGPELVRELVKNFLQAQFSSEERHLRRIKKVHQIEKEGHIK